MVGGDSMSNLFDFSQLKTLITKSGSSTVIIVDTNVFLNNPNFHLWKSAEKNPIFLISDRVVEEILRVRRRGLAGQKPTTMSKTESAIDAETARQALIELSNLGDISKGIKVEDVGWFLKFDCPTNERLKDDMQQLGALFDVLKTNDSTFLMLTKHCYEKFNDLLVVLVTGDQELYTCCKFRGVPIYLCKQLPDEGFDRWLLEMKTEKLATIDWDKELVEANKRIKKESYELSLTLTSKRFVKDWPCNLPDSDLGLLTLTPKNVVLAEGWGTVKISKDTYTFLWRIPYKPWISEGLAKDSLRGETSPIDWSIIIQDESVPAELFLCDETDIDWLGCEDKIPKNLLDNIVQLFWSFQTPLAVFEGLPSLQSPVALMLSFLEIEKFLEPVYKLNASYDLNQLLNNLASWITTNNDDEVNSFLRIVTSSWNIGHTITTRIKL